MTARALADWELAEVVTARRQGWTIEALAGAYGVSRRTIYRALGPAPRPRPHWCEAGGCIVETPRRVCYFHARLVSRPPEAHNTGVGVSDTPTIRDGRPPAYSGRWPTVST